MRRLVAGACFALAIAAAPAYAGRSCEDTAPDAATVQRALVLAERASERLQHTSARVVVIARAGQDLDRYRIRWSHMAFAYRDDADRWHVVHELNHCGTATSAIYRQGVGDFFLEGLHRYETAIVALRPDVGEKLMALFADDKAITRLHVERYNMLAYPWALEYQQSNQWLLETLAAAMLGESATRSDAQAWLRTQGYQPAVLRLDTVTRLGARLTRANVAFDDHPSEKRFSGRIETVTVDSVFTWLKATGLGSEALLVR